MLYHYTLHAHCTRTANMGRSISRMAPRPEHTQEDHHTASNLAATTLRHQSMSGEQTRRIRMGVVGGDFGAAFSWHEHPNSQVVAIAELEEDRRASLRETYGCDSAYATLEDLLKDRNVEAVAIFTPAPLHAAHAIQALKAGKHVFCAVPAAFSLEECHSLLETVKSTGLTYMMAETSFYRRETISARQWHREGRFGELFYIEGEYWHERLEDRFFRNGKRTWRYGLPPMHYPTHSTGFVVGVTGERLTEVQCVGWGDDSPVLQDNVYNNPFWNEVAFFRTNQDHSARVAVGWHLGFPEVERATWYGSRMSYAMPSPLGWPNALSVSLNVENPPVPDHYELLPEPLRHTSGHGGSHTHLTHEFLSALVDERNPAIDVYEALACTAPGIVAHQSALKDGELLKVPDFGRRPQV